MTIWGVEESDPEYRNGEWEPMDFHSCKSERQARLEAAAERRMNSHNSPQRKYRIREYRRVEGK